jgi:Asp-tRNA(Asn)/Glu-tRNA(Gln) amidotransferase A subunit family amidase
MSIQKSGQASGSARARSYDPAEFQCLEFASAVRLFASGCDSPRRFLERSLETVDDREPSVQAWVSLNVQGARAQADASTQRYLAGRPHSPIGGMPIGVKDVFNTKDMPASRKSDFLRIPFELPLCMRFVKPGL